MARCSVGYRHFETLDPALPDYSGVIVQVVAGYTLLERTKFDLDLARDVQYSYEDLEPYYLATGGRLTVTHQLVGPVRRAGLRRPSDARIPQHADWRPRTRTRSGRNVRRAARAIDCTRMFRVGFTWEDNRRLSELPDRRYERRRLFASLTYGS